MTDFSALFADPNYLLHRIDVSREQLVFIPTSRDRLRDASFLDGRIDFSQGDAVTVGFSQALSAAPRPVTTRRFVFHISFCGSTLLARMMDHPGTAVSLKEPHCLVDLADWKSSLVRAGRSDDRMGPLLRLACDALFRAWSPQEAIVVKPSNWVNNLLPEICSDRRTMRPLFVTMKLRPFLRAVLRGGRDRIAFTARVAAHLAGTVPAGDACLASAVEAAPDALGKAVNLAAVAHHLQLVRFADVLSQGGWTRDHVLDRETVVTAPLTALAKADAALGIQRSQGEARSCVERNALRNAKNPETSFSSAAQAEADRTIDEHHHAIIDNAVRWAEAQLSTPSLHTVRS